MFSVNATALADLQEEPTPITLSIFKGQHASSDDMADADDLDEDRNTPPAQTTSEDVTTGQIPRTDRGNSRTSRATSDTHPINYLKRDAHWDSSVS